MIETREAKLNEVKKKGVRAPREITALTSFLVKRVGMLAKDKTVAAFEGIGAVPYDYAVLAVPAQGACATQATIADALRYDRSYLVGVLDDLEARGTIERRRDPNDRRRHVVSLTKAGEQELDRLRGLIGGVESELFAPLTTAERQTLHGLLARVAAAHDPRYALDED
jgi:MarR family transcriptional regulator, lower aerobic nicotinate degradation pathway regulator